MRCMRYVGFFHRIMYCVLTLHHGSGKFWHRHRRPRPVTYNQDPEYHLGLRRETDQVKTGVKRKGRPPNSQLAAEKSDLSVEISSRLGVQPSEDDRAVSPVSTASSDTEAPLAQRVTKLNGVSHDSARGLGSSPGSPHPAGSGNTRPSSPRESSTHAPVSNGSYVRFFSLRPGSY
jgi:SWI/SNF-related matrix-associated actin-dependent regulator of chromatin subfamily B protein 1